MTQTRKAESSTSPPSIIGEPIRPGQIEGGNIDPVLVSGEIIVKGLPIIRPANTIRHIDYRRETNEALLLIDEHSAFNNNEPSIDPFDGNFIFNQSSVQYFNGNTIVNLDDIYQGANPVELFHYKFNGGRWRPVTQPTPNLDRSSEIERLGLEGTLNDFCLLVGEEKNMINGVGAPVTYGAVMIFIPSLLGAQRDINSSSSPIQIPTFLPTSQLPTGPDFSNHEFFSVCWKKEFVPSDTIWEALQAPGVVPVFAFHVSFIVGTERVGEQYIPKVYKLVWNGREAYVFDLEIENVISDGILFGCDYNDATDTLYVVGSGFEDSSKQIFAEFSLRTNTWTNKSPRMNENITIFQNGSGSLIQDGYGIRFIDNTAQFVSNNVKRGTAIWIDITDWNALSGTYPMNGFQSGIFFVQEVISETEVVLDKRMPNALRGGLVNPLFKWGFLNANIDATVTTVVIDVPQDLVGDTGVVGTSFPAGGGTFYLEGEQITYASSSYVDVIVVAKPYRRYTLVGCVRGVGGTMASPHLANIDGITSFMWPYYKVRTAAVLMEPRDYKAFSKVADCKLNTLGSSVFISGDNSLLKRYDIVPNAYVDFREKNPLPSSLDFGKMSWKPDYESFLLTTNSNSVSSVFLYGNDRLRLVDVPTRGIINTVSWSPDGLGALIGGRALHKYTRKLNVELAEREPRTIPVRYLFRDVNVQNSDPPITIVSSDVLAIDDLDAETLNLYVKVNPGSDRLLGDAADRMFEILLRIYLSGRGDEVDDIRKSWWKSILISDTEYRYNQNHYDAFLYDFITPNLGDVGYRRVFKLPEWAKYAAVDVLNKDKFGDLETYELLLTVGIQGGHR